MARMAEIEKMNAELKKILLEMPNSILIYDNNKRVPVLANTEFRKLLGCPHESFDSSDF